MSDFDRNYASLRGVGTDRAVAYDMGLRAHMISVYNYMAGGVALTGLVAWFTYQASVVTNASGSIVGLTPPLPAEMRIRVRARSGVARTCRGW